MIDAHSHIYGPDLHPEVLLEGERLGIHTFVCSSLGRVLKFHPTFEEVREGNDDMKSVIRRHPDRVAAYCYVNPMHGDEAVEDFKRRIEDENFIGLKLLVATLCNNPRVFPFIELAIDNRMPILIHCWRKAVGQLPYESSAWHVAELAERYPEARIIMAHLGGQAETAINTIVPFPNIRVDTSGSPIGANEVAIAAERLGAERVIFGSDIPGACLASNIGKVLGAGLPEEETNLILGNNMKRLLSEVKR
jgi:uncharacterized protein